VYRALIVCVIFLALLIAGGTMYGVFFKTAPKKNVQSAVPQTPGPGQGQVFTGIGQIRISTADPGGGTVILSVSFVYYPEDKAFSEELAMKVREFREIIMDYFGSFSGADLQKQDEESIKAELLLRFNAILRLGRIESLFFSDFMIV
jgi:flagellar basal body-associated protein FliL